MSMSSSTDHGVIGFIGTGVMGRSMALNLLLAGRQVVVHTRTRNKAEPLLEAGAVWQDSVLDVAAESDIVITMVGFPSDVEEVYLADGGIVHHARPGTFLIDMTTSAPELAQRIHQQARARGLRALDAPVSGGDVGARDGKLVIMVGGDEADFTAIEPVLRILGQNVIRQGPAGAGQHTKMCNQIAIASNMMGVCESLIYAQRAGLDPDTVLASISGGAAGSWSLNNLAPRILKGDFAPGFYIEHFIKDLRIALEMADGMKVPLPGVQLAKQLYDTLAERGYGLNGTQALYKYYEPGE